MQDSPKFYGPSLQYPIANKIMLQINSKHNNFYSLIQLKATVYACALFE